MNEFHSIDIIQQLELKCLGTTSSQKGHRRFRAWAIFSKKRLNILYPLIRIRTSAYQRVRNVSFLVNFAFVLNG